MFKNISIRDRRITDPFLDRRSAEDRRQFYDLDYFQNGGLERRRRNDRRQHGERRKNFVRVSDWSSVYTGHSVYFLQKSGIRH
jgi:hypothetical protein